MNRRNYRIARCAGVWSGLLWLGLGEHASANAGTPLLLYTVGHLLVGNALIGFGEGLVLSKVFGVPLARAAGLMFGANYASAWIGLFALNGLGEAGALSLDITNIVQWIWTAGVLAYLLTLALEWPFIAFALRGRREWLRHSLLASVLLQTVSYGVLLAWYAKPSVTSLLMKTHIASVAELGMPADVVVYYIEQTDGDVYRRQFRDGQVERILDLNSAHRNDRLLLEEVEDGSGKWSIKARLETEDRNAPQLVSVLSDLRVDAAVDRLTEMRRYGEVPKLGAAAGSPWDFVVDLYPNVTIRASNKAGGKQWRLGYETPFGAWSARSAVHLPGDKLLFQLDRDQICGFDPVTGRLALLWRGRGPVAVIPK